MKPGVARRTEFILHTGDKHFVHHAAHTRVYGLRYGGQPRENRSIWQAGQDELIYSLGSSRRPPPRPELPRKLWKNENTQNTRRNVVITDRDTQRIGNYCTTFFFHKLLKQASPQGFAQPSHPSDHGPPPSPHKDLIISRGPPSRVTYTTARISWYSGAGTSLLDPANQLLGGRVSPGRESKHPLHMVAPRLQRPGGFFVFLFPCPLRLQ